MKHVVKISLLLFFMFTQYGVNAVSFRYGVSNTRTSTLLNRTYKRPSSTDLIVAKKERTNTPQSDIVVTQEQFQNHFEAGKKRVAFFVEGPLSMDIGVIDETEGTFQSWSLPDLSKLSPIQVNMALVTPESSGILDYFPNATHALKYENQELANLHELYEMSEVDFFYLGYEEKDGDESFGVDYYSTLTPVPLEYGIEFEGIITFIDDVPEYDSIVYEQFYNVIGQGTLTTFDDGDVDMIKMNFTEIGSVYKDGIVIEDDIFHEIVWYGPEGHYLRAGISDISSEGTVDLDYILYMKVENPLAVEESGSELSLIQYPNPVAPGQVLNIQSAFPLSNSTVNIYNGNGQLVFTQRFEKGAQLGHYEVTVPHDLKDGNYFYKVVDKSSGQIAQGRILIK